MVTAGGPHYGRLLETKSEELRRALSDHLLLAVETARNAAGRVRPGGTLLFMTPEAGHPSVGTGSESTVAAAFPALVANLALEIAPVRVNLILIAAGFIDTPLSGPQRSHGSGPASVDAGPDSDAFRITVTRQARGGPSRTSVDPGQSCAEARGALGTLRNEPAA
jgi:NAD(P)-dependent dehydrogenase (short-subunit alcohol dehydrogenase family)